MWFSFGDLVLVLVLRPDVLVLFFVLVLDPDVLVLVLKPDVLVVVLEQVSWSHHWSEYNTFSYIHRRVGHKFMFSVYVWNFTTKNHSKKLLSERRSGKDKFLVFHYYWSSSLLFSYNVPVA